MNRTRSIVLFALALALAACKPDTAQPRTLVVRPLTLGSPQNLLLDPFIGGELKTGWGHFRAGYDTGASVATQRTFLSASPVGGAVSIEALPAGGVPAGATSMVVAAPFVGGPGTFHAAVWLSVTDTSGAPLPFDGVASAVTVAVTSPDSTSSTPLVPSAPRAFGGREWVSFTTAPDIAALPSGGWMTLTFTRVDVLWMVAAPEVTSSALTPTTVGGG
jgi:hypothetical protein